jgi:hypothetical protein
LQELVLELGLNNAAIFEPFCEKDYMVAMVREVLSGSLSSVDEIKEQAAVRFAAGITRMPWADQWGQLSHLKVGLLVKKDNGEKWFEHLDTYFEMRNCIIHRQGRVSELLNKKTKYYSDRSLTAVEIWPTHLDFYRKQFLDCVLFMETKIEAKQAASE